MNKTPINPINNRIVTEILNGKEEINYTKQMTKDNEDLKGSYNKIIGNLNAMTLRKYIINIINYHGLGYGVSEVNAFVSGCPVEWDLIIVKENAISKNNVYKAEDVAALVEFKMSGLTGPQFKNIKQIFHTQFNYLTDIRSRANRMIPFCYITFAETPSYFTKTKEYFDEMNGINDTAFAFINYSTLQNSDKKDFFDECNDFESFLYGIISINKIR